METLLLSSESLSDSHHEEIDNAEVCQEEKNSSPQATAGGQVPTLPSSSNEHTRKKIYVGVSSFAPQMSPKYPFGNDLSSSDAIKGDVSTQNIRMQGNIREYSANPEFSTSPGFKKQTPCSCSECRGLPATLPMSPGDFDFAPNSETPERVIGLRCLCAACNSSLPASPEAIAPPPQEYDVMPQRQQDDVSSTGPGSLLGASQFYTCSCPECMVSVSASPEQENLSQPVARQLLLPGFKTSAMKESTPFGDNIMCDCAVCLAMEGCGPPSVDCGVPQPNVQQAEECGCCNGSSYTNLLCACDEGNPGAMGAVPMATDGADAADGECPCCQPVGPPQSSNAVVPYPPNTTFEHGQLSTPASPATPVSSYSSHPTTPTTSPGSSRAATPVPASAWLPRGSSTLSAVPQASSSQNTTNVPRGPASSTPFGQSEPRPYKPGGWTAFLMEAQVLPGGVFSPALPPSALQALSLGPPQQLRGPPLDATTTSPPIVGAASPLPSTPESSGSSPSPPSINQEPSVATVCPSLPTAQSPPSPPRGHSSYGRQQQNQGKGRPGHSGQQQGRRLMMPLVVSQTVAPSCGVTSAAISVSLPRGLPSAPGSLGRHPGATLAAQLSGLGASQQKKKASAKRILAPYASATPTPLQLEASSGDGMDRSDWVVVPGTPERVRGLPVDSATGKKGKAQNTSKAQNATECPAAEIPSAGEAVSTGLVEPEKGVSATDSQMQEAAAHDGGSPTKPSAPGMPGNENSGEACGAHQMGQNLCATMPAITSEVSAAAPEEVVEMLGSKRKLETSMQEAVEGGTTMLKNDIQLARTWDKEDNSASRNLQVSLAVGKERSETAVQKKPKLTAPDTATP